MKLRISNISLNNPECIKNLCTTITKTKVLQLINFSWTSLTPEQMAMLSACLVERLLSMRTIDLSYNKLNFETDA